MTVCRQKTKDVFVNAAQYTECKAIDLTTFTMDPCWQVAVC